MHLYSVLFHLYFHKKEWKIYRVYQSLFNKLLCDTRDFEVIKNAFDVNFLVVLA